MIEKNKNMFDMKERPNQLVICNCGEINTVWLNVNGEGRTRCKCKCDITVEKNRRNSRIMIYHDSSKCKNRKSNSDTPTSRAV